MTATAPCVDGSALARVCETPHIVVGTELSEFLWVRACCRMPLHCPRKEAGGNARAGNFCWCISAERAGEAVVIEDGELVHCLFPVPDR